MTSGSNVLLFMNVQQEAAKDARSGPTQLEVHVTPGAWQASGPFTLASVVHPVAKQDLVSRARTQQRSQQQAHHA
jgi:hypothetical protein